MRLNAVSSSLMPPCWGNSLRKSLSILPTSRLAWARISAARMGAGAGVSSTTGSAGVMACGSAARMATGIGLSMDLSTGLAVVLSTDWDGAGGVARSQVMAGPELVWTSFSGWSCDFRKTYSRARYNTAISSRLGERCEPGSDKEGVMDRHGCSVSPPYMKYLITI